MVESKTHFQEVTPLAHVDLKSGSVEASNAGVHLEVRESLAIVQVFASQGQSNAVAQKLNASTQPGVATISEDLTTIPLSPGTWMVVADNGRNGGLRQNLSGRLAGLGHMSEQSHSRIVIRISGSRARQLMQKGCRLDLHPSIVAAGFCAQTSMAQTGVIVHQIDEAPVFDVMLYSGFADSFWHWLTESAAEYGYSVS